MLGQITADSKVKMQGGLPSADPGAISHLKLSLQRWQLLLDVYQFGRQAEVVVLQMADLAFSSVSPLKKVAALLLHTCVTHHHQQCAVTQNVRVKVRKVASASCCILQRQHIMCCMSTDVNVGSWT